MARRDKMDESALAALVDAQITDARQFATADLLWGRDKALEYARGEIADIPAEPGKSSVTSHDLSDHLAWIMPGLLRVFLASDKVAVFEPTKQVMGLSAAGEPIDLAAERAAQATNYLNYVFLSECGGYRVLHSAFTDGLLLGNGIVKHWWDGTPAYKTEVFTGLSDDQFAYLLSHPEVEAALEHSERRETLPSGEGAETAVVTLHDCKIKRRVTSGRLCVEALPPEEFLIERSAKALDESVRFCAHHYQETRSRLIERGYDRGVIDSIGESASATAFGTLGHSRDGGFLAPATHDGPDRSTELVDVYECYVLCDYDGDGIAERRRVVMAGGIGRLHMLGNEEWSDDLPFSDLVPDPVPHRWRGRSLFDDLQDVQRIKTVLIRQTLDNLYHVNNPMNEVLQDSVVNMDALINRELGANVFVKQKGAVTTLPVTFTAAQSFQMLDYWDGIAEKRTGIGRGTMGLDPDALQNQTAEAVRDARAASATRTETYARNMAETGLKRLFRCLLKLITAHQDRPRTIRLRGKWVAMDPTAWDPDMDVSINTGLGSGSRDRDLAMLQGVAAKQELILTTLGADNPIVTLKEYRDTLAKMTEAAGLRGPEQFFKEVTPEVLQALPQNQAQQAAQQQAAPDPRLVELAARLKLDEAKAAHAQRLREAEAAADLAHRRDELAARAAFERDKAAADLEILRERAAAEIGALRERNALDLRLAREKAEQDAALKLEELRLEAELKREEMRLAAAGAAAPGTAATNIEEAAPQ